MDNEIKGEGNSLNFEYRMHDPRVGRFFATDPLEPNFSWNSPYSFSSNRVIDKIELEGLEIADYWTTYKYKPVFTENGGSIIKKIGNAVENTVGFVGNITVVPMYNASGSAIDGIYNTFTGNYEFNPYVINDFDDSLNHFSNQLSDDWDDLIKHSGSEILNESLNSFTKLENYELGAQLILLHKAGSFSGGGSSGIVVEGQVTPLNVSAVKTSFTFTTERITENFTHALISASDASLPDMHIFIERQISGKAINFKVDVIPATVMDGTISLKESHTMYKNLYTEGISNVKKSLLNEAKVEGFETAKFTGKRETGVRAGELQESKTYNLKDL